MHCLRILPRRVDIEREIERVFLLFFIYTCSLLPNEHSTLSMACLDIGGSRGEKGSFFFFFWSIFLYRKPLNWIHIYFFGNAVLIITLHGPLKHKST